MKNKNAGLYIAGTVQSRTRRMVPADNPTTEIVTYIITDDNNRKYYIDDFAPASYHDINSYVELQVYVKPYRKRNGELSYSISIRKEYQPHTKGEEF